MKHYEKLIELGFEYYGYANQVFYEVYVTTQNRFQRKGNE